MGLKPWEAARINPAEAEALWQGMQGRFNRDAAVTAWAVAVLRPFMALAVRDGIAMALGKERVRLEPLDIAKLLRTIPGVELEE